MLASRQAGRSIWRFECGIASAGEKRENDAGLKEGYQGAI
jgi:hypothetical protein